MTTRPAINGCGQIGRNVVRAVHESGWSDVNIVAVDDLGPVETNAQLSGTGRLTTVAGGGDTVAAVAAAGVTGQFNYVSNAGGAFLEWLAGNVLPGSEVLQTNSIEQEVA